MVRNWFSDASLRAGLSAGDETFPEEGIELTFSPLWGADETLLRVLLWWDLRWFVAAGSNDSVLSPPVMEFTLDVIDTAAAEPPEHARGPLGQGLMSTFPSSNLSFSDDNPAFDAFRQHQGSSGAFPIDLHGQRSGAGFVGEAQLRATFLAYWTTDHPEGWYADARYMLTVKTSALLLQP